jgi:HAAS
MDARDQYLADVAERLPLPDDQRVEVLEELAAHLSDATAELVGQGRAPDEAESEAIRRLGSPDDLARALLQARRTRRQLLAAAGAGTWAAATTGLFGVLAGWVLVFFAAILATVAVQKLAPLAGLPATYDWTPGWNSVLTAGSLGVGAFLAAAAAVRAVSARAWRRPAEVRLSVAAVGMVFIGFLVLVVAEQSLNWTSVVAFLLVPVAFVVGTSFERVRLPSGRLLAVWFIVAISGLLAVGQVLIPTLGTSTPSVGSGYSWSSVTHGYAMIAPWWQDPAAGGPADFVSGDSSGGAGGEIVDVQAASAAVIGQFHGFRLEAWEAQAPGNGWKLIPGQRAPFASAPAYVDGATVSGTIRFDTAPGVDWAQIVLTAVGPDGRRYLLTAGGPEQAEFSGSVWAWFAGLTH